VLLPARKSPTMVSGVAATIDCMEKIAVSARLFLDEHGIRAQPISF
jgi:hypothetical protein